MQISRIKTLQVAVKMQFPVIAATGSLLILFLSLICPQIDANAIHHLSYPSEPYSYHFDPYSFGYDVEDNYGGKQWRQEKSYNPHEVHGSYGYRDKNGIYREVTYVADKNGFRANIKSNEPGVGGSKDPASVKMDSYYSPPAPPIMAAAQPQTTPIYAAKHYAGSSLSSYHQRA